MAALVERTWQKDVTPTQRSEKHAKEHNGASSGQTGVLLAQVLSRAYAAGDAGCRSERQTGCSVML